MALPLPAKYFKKLKSVIGRFLWSGKLEKLQINELKNSKSNGGLNLPCVFSKANALFLSQSCRILLSYDTKNFGHLKYLVFILGNIFPLWQQDLMQRLSFPTFNT